MGVIGTVLGVKLSQCRKRRYLSQRALAAAAGVSFATIKSIESGRVKSPHLRIVKQLSEALGVPSEDVDEFRQSLGLAPLEPAAE